MEDYLKKKEEEKGPDFIHFLLDGSQDYILNKAMGNMKIEIMRVPIDSDGQTEISKPQSYHEILELFQCSSSVEFFRCLSRAVFLRKNNKLNRPITPQITENRKHERNTCTTPQMKQNSNQKTWHAPGIESNNSIIPTSLYYKKYDSIVSNLVKIFEASGIYKMKIQDFVECIGTFPMNLMFQNNQVDFPGNSAMLTGFDFKFTDDEVQYYKYVQQEEAKMKDEEKKRRKLRKDPNFLETTSSMIESPTKSKKSDEINLKFSENQLEQIRDSYTARIHESWNSFLNQYFSAMFVYFEGSVWFRPRLQELISTADPNSFSPRFLEDSGLLEPREGQILIDVSTKATLKFFAKKENDLRTNILTEELLSYTFKVNRITAGGNYVIIEHESMERLEEYFEKFDENDLRPISVEYLKTIAKNELVLARHPVDRSFGRAVVVKNILQYATKHPENLDPESNNKKVRVKFIDFIEEKSLNVENVFELDLWPNSVRELENMRRMSINAENDHDRLAVPKPHFLNLAKKFKNTIETSRDMLEINKNLTSPPKGATINLWPFEDEHKAQKATILNDFWKKMSIGYSTEEFRQFFFRAKLREDKVDENTKRGYRSMELDERTGLQKNQYVELTWFFPGDSGEPDDIRFESWNEIVEGELANDRKNFIKLN